MEMKQLQFFKLTAELEHMTKAAEQLQVAQPFVSKIISELEEELGVKLFDQVGRGIQLNDYGRAFYKRVSTVFAELADAQTELKDMVSKRNQLVTLVTNTSLYMASLLGTFRKHMPDVTFYQASARRFSILRQLHDGEVDFAICSPAILDDPDLETIILIEEICPVIYPPNHWLKGRTSITLEELKQEDFISAIPGFAIRDLADSFFHRAGINSNIIVESTDTSVIPHFVHFGIGLGFSPLSSISRDPVLQENYIIVSDPPCIGLVGLTWKKNRFQSKAAKIFRDFSIEHFKNLAIKIR